MNVQDIYRLAIETGIAADPRGCNEVEKELAKAKKAYEKLSEAEKPYFDEETLVNPYADTRILVTQEEEVEIKRVLVGVDIETPELLLADALARSGKAIDLVIAHHPEGRALIGLPDVMGLQPGAMAEVGVLRNITESLLEGRTKEVGISVGVSNFERSVDAAKLLNLQMMCIHTPCDNLVTQFMTDLMEREAPETVGDICDLVREVPEYAYAAKRGNPPNIVAGSRSRSAGKVYVDFTGGTGGPKEYYKLLSNAGIGTVLCMHARKEVIDTAKENHLNVVIAGHMPSDSVGINLLMDKLAARGIEILPCSGYTRVSRN